MAVIEISRIQVRRGQENQTSVPTLAGGEFGWAVDTEHLYIGLRIEDGGARDANVRILTENDLFDIISPSQATSTYIYRGETNPSITAPTFGGLAFERPINKKNDDIVSVKDFGVEGVGGDEVASSLIQVAVDNLFLDPLKTTNYYGTASAKILYMPAGIYNIDTAIFIPKYTTIVGEGVGKTIINLISTSSHAFQTIDSDPGNANPTRSTFENYGIGTGVTQPNYIHIQGMTIQYSSTLTNIDQCLSLISLDCSENSIIRDVKFAGIHTINDIADNNYSGIDIRGYGSLHSSSNNLLIDNCEFTGLYHCIKSNYDVVSPIIQNSKFLNSVRGITFNDPKNASAIVGPRNSRIINNRFENIEQEGIYVGSSNSSTSTNHISMNNRFYNVGNKGGGFATLNGTPVITYLNDGNITSNDWFQRQEWQNENIYTTNLYPALVSGRTAIHSSEVKSVVVPPDTRVRVMRFPITGKPQQLIITYNSYAASDPTLVDRQGKATITIQPGSNPIETRITDEFQQEVGNSGIAWTITVFGPYKYYDVRVKHNLAAAVTIEYNTNLIY